MRIALVCPYDWNAHGGVADHVANLATCLTAEHEVRVFAPASGAVDHALVEPVGRPIGVRFNGSVAPVALAPALARRVPRSLRAWEPDLVHVHEPLAPMAGLAAAAWGPQPVIGTFHSWSDRSRVYRAAAPVGRRIARRLDGRIAVSPSARDYAAGALGLPASAFDVVPNGVDVDRFASAEPFGELADPERPLLLFVGRLERRKGLEVAVRAFLRLRATHPGARLCVVGDGPEAVTCKGLIPSSVQDDVVFAGRVDASDLPRYHASADLLLAPALGGESFGIVLLEGMAAGLPVVASDIPGFRTVMRDGHQGRLTPPGDPAALAAAVSDLLSDPGVRVKMAAASRATAAAHDWPEVARVVADRYGAAMRRR